MRLIVGKTYYTKPWYNSWRGMMSRCYRKKDASYKSYGGRGVKVCEELRRQLLIDFAKVAELRAVIRNDKRRSNRLF